MWCSSGDRKNRTLRSLQLSPNGLVDHSDKISVQISDDDLIGFIIVEHPAGLIEETFDELIIEPKRSDSIIVRIDRAV